LPAVPKKHLRPELLDEIRRHGNISRACRSVELSYAVVCQWRRAEPAFNVQIIKARKEGLK
jgi:molybdenum-dependent DNA-binding transcriptional regulator ModE